MLRRSEVVAGITACVLAFISAVLGWLIPTDSSESRVIANGVPQPVEVHTTSIAQFLGLPQAIGLLSTFALLGVWVVLASVLHARDRRSSTLSMLWVGTGLLTVGSLLVGAIVPLLFIPGALLALTAAVLGSVRQYIAVA